MKNVALIFLVLLAFSYPAQAQGLKGEKKVDSLITILIGLEESPEKANVLNEISYAYRSISFEKSMEYAQLSLSMAEDLRYQEGIYNASFAMSNLYANYYLNYFEAMHHLSIAMEIAEESEDYLKLVSVYQSFAFLKSAMGDYEESLKYYDRAISLAKDESDYNRLANLYSYKADVYYEEVDTLKAKQTYKLVVDLKESGKVNSSNVSVPLSVAMYYRLNGDYQEAVSEYRKSILDYRKALQPRFESYSYSQLGQCYIETGNFEEAISAGRKGLDIAINLNLAKERLDNYQILVSAYDSLQDEKNTYLYLIKSTQFKDSLFSSQINEQTRKFQSNYEEIVQRNEMEKLKNEKENQELVIENQKLSRNLIIGALAFAIVLVILMILRLRYKNKKEKELRVLSLATSLTTNSIILFDKDVRVEWVNKGFEKLTGMSEKEVKGKYFLEFYNGPELDEEKRKELTEKFSGTEGFTSEMASYHRETGEEYWISINVTPLFNNDNELINYVSVASDISAIHQTQIKLEKSYETTVLLNEIGSQITSTLSVPEIIEKVYENVNKLMDATNFGIGIYRKKEDDLYFPNPVEKGKKLDSFSFNLKDKDRLAVQCFKDGKEILANNLQEMEAIFGANLNPIAGEQPSSLIYIPLIAKNKRIGVISVQSFHDNAYLKNEIEIVKSLAIYVGIAIENASLYQNLEEKVEERTAELVKNKEELQTNYENVKLLSEIGIEISSSLEFEGIFESLHSHIAKVMDAEIFGVRIFHPDKNMIEYKYEIENGVRDPVEFIPMDDKDNYSVWCVENQKEIFLNDNRNEYQKYVNEIKVPSGEMPNSLIFYPMFADGKVIGVITIQSFKVNAYTPYHLDIVKTLAAYTGSALNNAALYDTLEQKVEERTSELAKKNRDIMASIEYAKRIQTGILPAENFVQQLIPKNFVLYKPRETVSGDFYWFERKGNKIFFAVVDCTGHGVPGALMSIIGKNILDQAVNEKGLEDPSMILTFLRAGLQITFGTEDRENTEVQLADGMDLGICVYDEAERYLDFAGAKSNLYIVRNGELEVVKGDWFSVSASEFVKEQFTSHEVPILQGDKLYMTSDGYIDQFGGTNHKRFSKRRFLELLPELAEMDIDKQLERLNKELMDWQGDVEQLDDICVLGVEL